MTGRSISKILPLFDKGRHHFLSSRDVLPKLSAMTTRLKSHVELTSVRYPSLKRGKFAQLEDHDIQQFQSILEESRVVTDASDLEGWTLRLETDQDLMLFMLNRL